MLDRVYAIDDEFESLILELFLEQKVAIRTERGGLPGIYFCAIASVAPKQ